MLHTVRLSLEPYGPADERDFWTLFDDPRVTRWLGSAQEGPGHGEMFRRIFATPLPGQRFDAWAVREGGQYVGHAEIGPGEGGDGHELTYALRPQVWGNGLGREIAEALAAYGLEVLMYDAVYATVDARNAASLAVLSQAGFVHTKDVTPRDGRLSRVLTRESQRVAARLR
ncbi:MAG: GNAT family N-acetyltransferase [Actinomycetes bacterium]